MKYSLLIEEKYRMKGGICHLEYHHRSFIWAEHVHWELVLSNYVLLSVTMYAT